MKRQFGRKLVAVFILIIAVVVAGIIASKYVTFADPTAISLILGVLFLVIRSFFKKFGTWMGNLWRFVTLVLAALAGMYQWDKTPLFSFPTWVGLIVGIVLWGVILVVFWIIRGFFRTRGKPNMQVNTSQVRDIKEKVDIDVRLADGSGGTSSIVRSFDSLREENNRLASKAESEAQQAAAELLRARTEVYKLLAELVVPAEREGLLVAACDAFDITLSKEADKEITAGPGEWVFE